MDPALLWFIAALLVVVGLVGTIVPGLPGVAAVFAGMLLAAWIDGFTRIGWPTLIVLGILTALAVAAELAGSLLGARRVGASRLALIGAVIGTFAGLPLGLFGLIVGPFVGAVAGEFLYRRRLGEAAKIGLGTWVGLAFGSLAKVALVFAMLGAFALGYFL